jgi:hypothetical protein
MVTRMNRGVILLMLGVFAAGPAHADGFRCGTRLVLEGATRSEVSAKCGEPTEVTTMRSVYRRPVIWSNGRPYFIGEDFIEVPVESWVYNLGPNKLMRRIRFEAGVVTDIETLGYGYN